MNSVAITDWLEAPATLPDSEAIDAALRAWPWFVPARMMDAVREHQLAPFSDKTLSTLRLYGSDWLPAYGLLEERVFECSPVSQQPGSDFVEDAEISDEALYEQSEAVEEIEEVASGKEQFIQPLYTEDYFRHQGIQPEAAPETSQPTHEQPQTLMVVMSFAEWLNHFKVKSQKEEEEAREKRALRSMWQQEKLAAALEDEPDEIPEDVFEMAVTSITKEDDVVSEPLAQIYERQEKWSAAADMYRRLALKYPVKSHYFASRAEAAKKRLL